MGVKLTQLMIDGAKRTEKEYGVPASITLGQIMLESGGSYDGGLSMLASLYNNLFGVTAGSSWNGKTIYLTNKNGTDGQTYRIYDSQMDSILDHGKVLTASRYTQYTSNAKTIQEYAEGIKKGGYATDPNYASKLMNVITSNNLTQYDGEGWQGKSGAINTGSVGGNDIVLEDGTAGNMSSVNETDMKWWGDLIVIILSVLLIALSVVFFVLAFNGGSIQNVGLNVVNKATKGAVSKLQKVGK